MDRAVDWPSGQWKGQLDCMSKEHVWTGVHVTSIIFYDFFFHFTWTLGRTGPWTEHWTGQVVNGQDSWTVCQRNINGQVCMELLSFFMICFSLGHFDGPDLGQGRELAKWSMNRTVGLYIKGTCMDRTACKFYPFLLFIFHLDIWTDRTLDRAVGWSSSQ